MKDFRILFIYPNLMMSTLVPIHIPLLSACLKRDGFCVDLFDTTYYKTEDVSFDEKKVELLQVRKFNMEEHGIVYKETSMYKDLVKKVLEFNPDLIAISIVEDTYKLSSQLLDAIKDFDIPVIAGGVFATFSSEELINNEHIDMICIGEGEEALLELCNKLYKRQDYSDIKNLWLKHNGKIIKNKLRKTVDINTLPFIDIGIFEPKRLYRPMYGKINIMIHVELDRGCPYKCTYCESPQLMELYQKNDCGSYYKRKTVNFIIEEMKFLIKKHHPAYIYFNSESFLARPLDELQAFAERYREEIKLPFWCQSRTETVTEEKIKLIKEMNCQNLQFGIEQGNEEFRARVLHRRCSNDEIVDAIKIADKYKIAYTVNNIIGFPDETRDLVFDTIELNRKISPVTTNCYLFTPYKGTGLYNYCIEKGYIDKNSAVNQLLNGTELKMKSITYNELKGLQRTFPLYVKMPKSEWDIIKQAEKFDNQGNTIFEKLRTVYYERYFR